MASANRKMIVRSCKQRGWTIQPIALQSIENYLSGQNNRMSDLNDLLDLVGSKLNEKRTITGDVWDEIIQDYSQDQISSKRGTHVKNSPIEIIDAFAMPRLGYDTMHKQFQIDEQRRSLFGSAEDKIGMLAQRYALIHQRILSHELFRPNDLHGRRANVQHALTPIESLLGKRNHQSNVLLLGILLQIEEGDFYLEDLTGQVRVSFKGAAAVDEFFVTENCFLLVEGSFHDDIFYVDRLGQPLLESRETSIQAIQHQVSHSLFTMRQTVYDDDSSMVMLSDVHLDQAPVLHQLEELFARFENYSPHRVPLFVLMGNFCSRPQLNPSEQLRPLIDELYQLLARFSNLARHAHFCLVPGPHDGVGHVLPYRIASIKSWSSTDEVAHFHVCSNPCRIRWGGREVVVFRQDMLQRFQLNQIRMPNKLEDGDEERRQPHCRMIKTMLDQGHLMPITGTPIFWNYDAALRLYPLPDALVLGDATCTTFHENYGDCDVIQPGSFAKGGKFAVFSPNVDDSDDMNENSDPVRTIVEFGQVGTGDETQYK